MPYNILRPSRYGIDFYGDSLFTTQELAQSDPKLVNRFVRASRFTITRLLEKNRCLVTAVEDGREVLDSLLEKEFDLILMDIQMPHLSSIETTKAIRERQGGAMQADIA